MRKIFLNRWALFLIALMILVFLSLSVVSYERATSKVSYDRGRGFPFTWLYYAEYQGPCNPEGMFCARYHDIHLSLGDTVLSFLFFFPLAMAIGGASFKLLKASL
jgi:hypothetical protein